MAKRVMGKYQIVLAIVMEARVCTDFFLASPYSRFSPCVSHVPFVDWWLGSRTNTPRNLGPKDKGHVHCGM